MTQPNRDRRTLLIVDDDPGLLRQLGWCFSDDRVVTAGTKDAALDGLRRHAPNVVLLDLGLPPDATGTSEGLACLQDMLTVRPFTKVIVMTGNGDKDSAVRAIGLGAWDFYAKPVHADVLRLLVDRAFHVAGLEAEHRARADSRVPDAIAGVVAVSEPMVALCRKIEKVAPTDVSVLLLGESGTGKELLARALHRLSGRQDDRFVAINCAAIPESLLESELFGYEKGAFTGAAKTTPGKIELANRGTLFLDEIGDMAPALQAKLLRFLQERVVERVGGRVEIPVDVRVICATNQELEALIEQGRFRTDLFYRVGEVTLRVPPLRDRPACIPVIARLLLRAFGTELKRPRLTFSPDALRALESHSWPGNVRELENRVKTAVVMSDGTSISAEDLSLPAATEAARSLDLREVRRRAERTAVREALALTEGNVCRAAELLGITRPTLYDLLQKLGIAARDSQPAEQPAQEAPRSGELKAAD